MFASLLLLSLLPLCKVFARSPVENSSSPFAWPQDHNRLASGIPQAPSPLQQALPAKPPKLNGSVKGNLKMYRMSDRMSRSMSDHAGSCKAHDCSIIEYHTRHSRHSSSLHWLKKHITPHHTRQENSVRQQGTSRSAKPWKRGLCQTSSGVGRSSGSSRLNTIFHEVCR